MLILKSVRWPLKDKLLRKSYKRIEINKIVLKSLIQSEFITLNERIYFSKVFYSYTKKASLSSFRKSCAWSGNSSKVFKKFKLSRYFLKTFASNGLVTGFRKSSF